MQIVARRRQVDESINAFEKALAVGLPDNMRAATMLNLQFTRASICDWSHYAEARRPPARRARSAFEPPTRGQCGAVRATCRRHRGTCRATDNRHPGEGKGRREGGGPEAASVGVRRRAER